jgi:hypothetical protein
MASNFAATTVSTPVYPSSHQETVAFSTLQNNKHEKCYVGIPDPYVSPKDTQKTQANACHVPKNTIPHNIPPKLPLVQTTFLKCCNAMQ